MTQTQSNIGAAPASGGDAAFQFVQELAQGLSRKDIELPSFPAVAVRVRKVLADEDVSTQDIVRVVGSEAALAARIVQMANSAALCHVGKPIADLRAAITRIGFNLVRSASITFAMSQMRRAGDLKAIDSQLQEHWQRSTLVAAFSYVVARRFTKVNPDMALLAGLLHGVGRLYIMTRAVKHPRLFSDAAAYHEIERDWHASIATAMLETWGMPDAIVKAIADHEDQGRDHSGPPDLTDVLTVGSLLATFHGFPETLELNMQGVRAAERMQLDRVAMEALIEESESDIAALRHTLGM
jgi:HD-like signal output (HDOD) protein